METATQPLPPRRALLSLLVLLLVLAAAGLAGCEKKGAYELTNEGLALVRAGHPDRALRRFEKAIRVDPDYPYGYYYAAGLYNGRHQWRRAEGYLHRFLELRPEDGNGWYTLAFCLEGQARELLGEGATDLHGAALRSYAAAHPPPLASDRALVEGYLARAQEAYAKAKAAGLPIP
ncbi:MAG: hypothetical protein D6739_11775 [Nitrospirae bacterium]|nr:MAG: hypothetical protein D6739_11775 [Nitrospirota bacterium]